MSPMHESRDDAGSQPPEERCQVGEYYTSDWLAPAFSPNGSRVPERLRRRDRERRRRSREWAERQKPAFRGCYVTLDLHTGVENRW